MIRDMAGATELLFERPQVRQATYVDRMAIKMICSEVPEICACLADHWRTPHRLDALLAVQLPIPHMERPTALLRMPAAGFIRTEHYLRLIQKGHRYLEKIMRLAVSRLPHKSDIMRLSPSRIGAVSSHAVLLTIIPRHISLIHVVVSHRHLFETRVELLLLGCCDGDR